MSAGRRSARALNVVLYILFIYRADRSVNYVSVFVCGSVCILSVSVCVCVPHWRQHILAALSERSHIESAKVIFIYIYVYIVHISMHARL